MSTIPIATMGTATSQCTAVAPKGLGPPKERANWRRDVCAAQKG